MKKRNKHPGWKVVKIPTGRFCRICGKEIMREEKEGIITFNNWFYCKNTRCNDKRKRQVDDGSIYVDATGCMYIPPEDKK